MWLPGLEPELLPHDGSGDRWMTPPSICRAVHGALGGKWFDPCGDPASPTTAMATAHFDVREGQDGLSDPWPSDLPAYVNPPFSEASKWVEKCSREHSKGRAVIAMVPLRPEGSAWHSFIWPEAEVVIPKGRIKFVGLDGQTHGSAMIGTAMVCWGTPGHKLSYLLAAEGIQSVVILCSKHLRVPAQIASWQHEPNKAV